MGLSFQNLTKWNIFPIPFYPRFDYTILDMGQFRSQEIKIFRFISSFKVKASKNVEVYSKIIMKNHNTHHQLSRTRQLPKLTVLAFSQVSPRTLLWWVLYSGHCCESPWSHSQQFFANPQFLAPVGPNFVLVLIWSRGCQVFAN